MAEGKRVVEELARLKYEMQHDRALTYDKSPPPSLLFSSFIMTVLFQDVSPLRPPFSRLLFLILFLQVAISISISSSKFFC